LPEQLRGFWVDSDNPGFHNSAEIDELISNALRAKANTLFVQMRRHGDAWYSRRFEPRAAKLTPDESFDPLAELLQKGQAVGLQIHAWLVIGVACPPREPVRDHPDHVCAQHGPSAPDPLRWTTATQSGAQISSLDYGHPETITYLERVVTHLIQAYPELDGIHYDFIRYDDVQFGYNAVSLERFARAYNRPIGERPSSRDPQWSQWRRDRVTELVRRLYIRIKALDPQIQVSAATITWGGAGQSDWRASAAYSRVFQDWPAWLEEGIIDFAIPMQYFADGSAQQRGWYDGWLAFGRERVGRRAIVVGTGAWLNSAEQGMDQIQRAVTPDDQGRMLSGAVLFSYDQPLAGSSFQRRREYMDQLGATVWVQPSRPPAWPWVFNPTQGHLQGMARIDDQIVADATVTIWQLETGAARQLTPSADGWYGAVDLEPGTYLLLVEAPDGRKAEYQVPVIAGQVTSGP
jgi:uncharacterized lipoprotein YddW (UPF0748 family)